VLGASAALVDRAGLVAGVVVGGARVAGGTVVGMTVVGVTVVGVTGAGVTLDTGAGAAAGRPSIEAAHAGSISAPETSTAAIDAARSGGRTALSLAHQVLG
jgi:hypothetical protein